jgi:hypothetical protein
VAFVFCEKGDGTCGVFSDMRTGGFEIVRLRSSQKR